MNAQKCSDKNLDIVVFGATSFVGKLVCQYLAAQYGVDGQGAGRTVERMKWGIAGRSRRKLNDLLKTLGAGAEYLPVIIADAAAESDLHRLCGQSRVIISTVGPYALHGSPLVKVCVETGTDYCDLAGEPQWIHQMIRRYENTAKNSGSRIVHSCGFDSIPSDMGTWFLQQQSVREHGETCAVVCMRVQTSKGGISGGTIASLLNLWKEEAKDPELQELMADSYSNCPADTVRNSEQRSIRRAERDANTQGWIGPFAMAPINERMVLRSNALAPYHTDFSYNEAVVTGAGFAGAFGARALAAAGRIGSFALRFPSLIRLLENNVLPKSGEGPSPKAQAEGFFDLRFFGSTGSGRKVAVKVTGKGDPGYASTAKMLSQAAVSLALDIPKAERAGGFWTTATVFDGRLIERLEKYAEMKFEQL